MSPDDVVVLGGGPAGSMAALMLARGGVACRLLERSPEIPERACGDFLSAEGVARLQALGFPWSAAQATRVHGLRMERAGCSVMATLPFDARSVRRLYLDRWLLQAAADAGARVDMGQHVRSVSRVDGSFRLDSSDGPVFARRLILASGKHGLGSFHERRPAGGPALLGWKMNFRKLGKAVSDALAETLCLFPFPGGYGGISRVAEDMATVALLVQPSVFAGQKHDQLGPLPAIAGQVPLLARLLDQSEPAWQRPVTVANLPYGHCDRGAEPDLFPVGDQFAVLPSFTGTGVSFAMASGAAAAWHIMHSPSESAAGAYAAQARSWARPVLRMAMPLHRLLQAPALAALAIRWLSVLPQIASFLARHTRLPSTSTDGLP